jgi:heme-degrading monooxygenase HmoA
MSMIARVWRGWTEHGNAAAYEQVFSKVVLPELEAVAGLSDAYLLRRRSADEVEFVALTIFESLSAVRDFAGKNYETAVISTEAKQVLKRFEERAAHYEIVIAKTGRV